MTSDASSTVIVTGADANFFSYLIGSLRSLRAHPALDSTDIVVFDQGLTESQIELVKSLRCRVMLPEWNIPVPDHLRDSKAIGLVARVGLREYLPGYKYYLWFDADAWAQTPEFLTKYVEGAARSGAAVSREPTSSPIRHFREQKWWFGNMILSYGIFNGLKAALATRVNIGILCMGADAPHWDAWRRRYIEAIERSGKLNMDQHAFVAAVALDRLDVTYLAEGFNWQPILTTPNWDERRALLCNPAGDPISVIHLSGPNKSREYELERKDGTPKVTTLTFDAIAATQGK